MKTKVIGMATLLAACLVWISPAQVKPEPRPASERQSVATERSTARNEGTTAAPRKSSDNSILSSGNSEVFEGVFIGADKTVSLDSKLDYTSAATVAIGIECTLCDSTADSLGSSGLVLLARWAVPNAELYVTTENKATTLFPYWDAGGVIFNVYGSQFRLSLQNKGSQPVAIEQITIFRRGS